MNNMPDSSSMTLESIALRKKELRKKLHVQKEIMTDTARELFAPLAPAADKGNAIMRAFNTGIRRTNARSKDDEKGQKHVRSQKINRRHKAKKAAFFH